VWRRRPDLEGLDPDIVRGMQIPVPAAVQARARVLVGRHELQEAIAEIRQATGYERHDARCVVLTMNFGLRVPTAPPRVFRRDWNRHRVVASVAEMRAVTWFGAECAQHVLGIFEEAHPGDLRPREAVEAAWAFARGGEAGPELDATRQAAFSAAQDAQVAGGREAAAGEAASAAAVAAIFATVKASEGEFPDLVGLLGGHEAIDILGAAVNAALAAESAAGGDREVSAASIREACRRASPGLIAVLKRYPGPQPRGGRRGELLRELDSCLRARRLPGGR
jgi:hypothetical protein